MERVEENPRGESRGRDSDQDGGVRAIPAHGAAGKARLATGPVIVSLKITSRIGFRSNLFEKNHTKKNNPNISFY